MVWVLLTQLSLLLVSSSTLLLPLSDAKPTSLVFDVNWTQPALQESSRLLEPDWNCLGT